MGKLNDFQADVLFKVIKKNSLTYELKKMAGKLKSLPSSQRSSVVTQPPPPPSLTHLLSDVSFYSLQVCIILL